MKLRGISAQALRLKAPIILASLTILALGLYLITTTPITQNVYLSYPRDSDLVKASEILLTRFDVSRLSTVIVVAEGRMEELEAALRDLESRGGWSRGTECWLKSHTL